MPSTYTLNNGIELIGTGEQSGTWGDTTNLNFELLDTALDGQVAVALAFAGSSGSPNNLPISDGAASNGRNRMITFSDSSDLGATAYVQLTPNDSEKIIYVRNDLSGSRSIIMFQGTYNASNDYEIPAGTTAIIYFDGAGSGAVAANVFNNAYFDSLRLGGVSVTAILDEDDMSSDSATALATQQSIKKYVDDKAAAQDTLAEVLANGNATGGTDIEFGDNDKAIFGAGSDLQIYHDPSGPANYINDTGAGDLIIRGSNQIRLQQADGDSLATFNEDGSVQLYYDGNEKLATTSTGVDVTGTITADGLGINTTDPVSDLSVSVGSNAPSTTGSMSSDGLTVHNGSGGYAVQIGVNNTGAYNYIQSGYVNNAQVANDLAIFTGASEAMRISSTGLDVTGEVSADTINISPSSGFAKLEMGGPSGAFIDFKAPFSDDYDGRVIYDATASNLTITTQSSTEPVVLAQGYVAKLSTTNTGIDVTGTVTADGLILGDNDKAIFGTNSDLRIFHDGTNTQIDNNTGTLIVRSSAAGTIEFRDQGAQVLAQFNDNSDVKLYHNNNEKLATTSTGIDVTGTVTADGLTVEKSTGDADLLVKTTGTGDADATIILDSADSGESVVNFKHDGVLGASIGWFTDGSPDLNIVTEAGTNGVIDFQPNNIFAMRIDANQNVGIGTGSPQSALHIRRPHDDTTPSGAPIEVLRLEVEEEAPNPNLAVGDGVKMSFYIPEASFDSQEGAAISAVKTSGTDSNANTALTFSTAANDSPLVEAMRIDQNSKVGISNTAPDALLHIGDENNSLGTTAGDEIKLLTLQADVSNSDFLQFTSERISTGTDWESAAHRIQRKVDATPMGYMQFGRNASDLITFGDNNSEYMRIAGGGKVLVDRDTAYSDGTIGSPSLQVDAVTGSRAGLAVIATATTATAAVGFVNPNGSIGNISLSGSSTAYNTSSDYRLKTDAQPMTGASARVQALNPVNFEWIADGTRVDGFLAHEAQEVVPEAVTGTKDAMCDEEYEVTPAVLDDDGNEVTPAVMGTRSVPDYQGIDQSKLVPLLTAALQEALTKIDDMETRLAALEG